MNVSGKLISKELAHHLWNATDWKYIYFGNNIELLDFPMKDFNKMVGYTRNYPGRKFDILSLKNKTRPINVKKVLEKIGFNSLSGDILTPKFQQFLTIDQVASILNLEKNIVLKLITEGDIIAHNFDKYLRIDPSDLNKFIFNHKV